MTHEELAAALAAIERALDARVIIKRTFIDPHGRVVATIIREGKQ